jgi:ABC-type bacteriocin/lantibiotic exporter with double-glycine peptidase domain
VIAASISVQLLGVITPQLTRVAIDRAFPNAASSLLAVVAIGVALIALFQAWISWLREKALIYTETRTGLVLESTFVEHLIRLPYAQLQSRTTGQLLQSVYAVAVVRELIASRGFAPVINGLLAVCYLAVFIAMMPVTAVPATVVAIVLVALGIGAALLQARLRDYELAAESAEQSLLVEVVGNISTVKAAAAERQTITNWLEQFYVKQFFTLRRQRITLFFDVGLDLVQQVLVAGALFWGATLVFRGEVTAGALIAAVQLMIGFIGSTMLFIGGVSAFIHARPEWERVRSILAVDAEKTLPASERTFRGTIAVERASFRYSADRPWVLKDFSLRVEAGEKVFLSAHSGFGKSTILRLIAGLYDPEGGTVTIGGLEPRHTRDQIAYLPQFAAPIGGSIMRNLRFFSGNAPLQRVMEAAADTGLHEWVRTLPMGYDTVLPPRGETVSGGQRQLIALTGVLASERPILLLDEFVACLDALSRQRVLNSRFLENRTVIFADHKPAEVVTETSSDAGDADR